MDVRVISSEIIIPSSPTPAKLKYYKISLLDQYADLSYVPLIVHYPQTKHRSSTNQVLGQLKSALASALSLYYPLAGRIRDHLYIDCNDEGVLFLEARVSGDIQTFLQCPDHELMFKLCPANRMEQMMAPQNKLVHVCIQANVFSCGGIAIGVCVLHKIADGVTMAAFLKCWANIAAEKSDKVCCPDLTSASSNFPPDAQPIDRFIFSPMWIKEGKCVMRRFIFNKIAINTLKKMAASESVPFPTSAEVLTCFFWKFVLKSTEKERGVKLSSVIVSPKDIRSLTVPPMSHTSVGNVVGQAILSHDDAESRKELGFPDTLVQLRESFKKIDGDFVEKMQGEKDFIRKLIVQSSEFLIDKTPEPIFFTSVTKLRLSELDFGWGRPVWVNHIRGWSDSKLFINQVVLEETCWDIGGIEAWAVLGEKVMKILETDPEFLTFASVNPSIPLPRGRL